MNLNLHYTFYVLPTSFKIVTKTQTYCSSARFSCWYTLNGEKIKLNFSFVLKCDRAKIELSNFCNKLFSNVSQENELILMTVLNCVYDSISQILRKNVEKKALFQNLDIVMLAIDEICDRGVILEADPNAVVSRVALRTDDIPLGEQTVAQVHKNQPI